MTKASEISRMTEEEVKLRYITPAIECKWDKHAQMRMEYFFTDGRIIIEGNAPERGKRKKADYLLSLKPNLPLAIVEAKSNHLPMGAGLQQGIEYAQILDVPFVYSSNGDGFLERDMINGREREIALDDFPAPDDLWARYKVQKQYKPEQEKLVTQSYHSQADSHPPRYYQRIAINRTIEAIANGKNRILLVMATGTGKTFTAFQIIYRLLNSGAKRKILFLADRNVLVDQAEDKDFKPFNKVMTKIKGRKLDSSYQVYLSLYQQLAGDENEEPFRQFEPSFFDLIVVDECHRGSAKDESRWRKILEYFSSATQIGLTATPKETKDVSNIDYFGEPIYTYSLKQGIDDGFLAPYKVVRVGLDRDLEGWRPPMGKLDIDGNEIEDREYNIKDFDKNLIIDDRTKAVAKRITTYLCSSGRFDKTIVFCVDIEHAERMRQALVNENSDLIAENANYIMRITGDNDEGKDQLYYFQRPSYEYPNPDYIKHPTIVTTSKLLTTGVDVPTCKLIVLDNVINSMTEFKQIIGRGTRLKPDYGKEYFTIMDFRGVSRLFADPAFDGDPISVIEDDGGSISEGQPELSPQPPSKRPDGDDGEDSKLRKKYRINDVEVSIVSERVQYYGGDGKLTTESLTDFSRKNILGEYTTLNDFLKTWNDQRRKQAILDELKERGVLLEELKKEAGNRDIDDFDLICHIAFDKKPLTKAERANNVRKRDYLSRYEGLAKDVLATLLDKYATDGIADMGDTRILSIDPFRRMASLERILTAFGGSEGYMEAVQGLQGEIYAA